MAFFTALMSCVVLAALLGTSYGQTDECSMYTSCDECIAGSGCVWCPDLPPFSGSRCTRPENAECLSKVEDPIPDPPDIMRDDPLGETTQIAPQEVVLNLRTGVPQTFTLSVKPARNYPLDFYILMDISGSQAQDLEILRNLSTSITEELQNISSQFALGFGSFVDKIAYPYASTLQNGMDYLENNLFNGLQCASGRFNLCEPTYTYRHQLNFTNNTDQFEEVLLNTSIRGNLDSPEATLEALQQAVVCSENVAWRNNSLRIVMILTDAGFKTALDGKVAAILRRNDGECHLQPNMEGFDDYVRNPEQDFPSIYQVRQKLIDNEIITIFAVAEDNSSDSQYLYSNLAEELGGSSRSFVQPIQRDSSDIVTVIREAYESITQDIVVEGISGLNIAVTPGLNCTLTPDGMGCAGVTVEQLVRFNVTVTMEECLGDTVVKSLSLPGFGNVELTLVPICECNCSSAMVPNHTACNNEGSLVCGTCMCSESYGEQCECNRPLSSCPDNCFNRGTCDECSRKCTSCDTNNVDGMILGYFYGSRCQCDNTTTGRCPAGTNSSICSDRGDCECDPELCGCTCNCDLSLVAQEPYFGPSCACDPNDCYNEMYPNKLCAHKTEGEPDGECECDGCDCPINSVHFNKTCLLESDLCTMYEECARCGLNCTLDDCHPGSLDDSTGGVVCELVQNDCIIDYEVFLSGPFDTIGMIFVGEERDCQSSNLGQLAWIIAVSIVGGVLVLGVVLLVVAKIILVVIDKREYKKFLDDMHTGDFTPHNNPLYVTPESEHKNPMARSRKVPAEDSDNEY